MEIIINKKVKISNNQRPLIVAEISANHCGNKKKFISHIKKAASSGADLIKIQTYEAEDMTIRSDSKSFKLKEGLWKGNNLWRLYSKAQTPFEWHDDAFKIAKKMKKVIFSTPFSERGVDLLEKLNVQIYKISSFEITDLNLVEKISKTRKPIILSTGISNKKEIRKCMKLINKYHNKVIILHCVSGYPTPEDEVNLFRINDLKKEYPKNLIGLSDHTNDINTSLASVPLGVSLIEKHYKLNNKIKSPDSQFSIDSNQLRELKRLSIKYFKSLKIRKKFSSENQNKIFRRSLYVVKDMKKGQQFTKKNILSLRPKIGICASKFKKILGKKAKVDLTKDTPLFRMHIK